MRQGGDTEPLNMAAAYGLGCAACGDEETPGLSFPVMTPDGRPRLPKLCLNCLSSLFGVAFANAGHAHDAIARAVIGIQVEGFKVPRPT